MFLAESVIPESPIARSMCFDNFSEIHYHNMTENQRKQFLITFKNSLVLHWTKNNVGIFMQGLIQKINI